MPVERENWCTVMAMLVVGMHSVVRFDMGHGIN